MIGITTAGYSEPWLLWMVAAYAGTNVSKMAQTLVEEQADEIVARLYSDYCRNAAVAAPKKAK